MSLPEKFNVRVYGIWLHEGSILINEELIRGRKVIKFPGGGLDLGEGTRDGLKREWEEELNLDIEVLDHFYTTDFFQQSAFDNSQVLSIYYWVKTHQVPEQIINYVENERTFWMRIEQITSETFTLPIDKIVGRLICERLRY